jgi:hypothetical protein
MVEISAYSMEHTFGTIAALGWSVIGRFRQQATEVGTMRGATLLSNS